MKIHHAVSMRIFLKQLYLRMNKKFVCVEGNIGAGKTTLAKMLADYYNGKLLLENFDNNPYLKDFYIDSKKYALQVELSFLAERYQQQLDFLHVKDIVVSDYLFEKSLIFAKINLSSNEFAVFKAAYSEAIKQIKQPDVIVFLDATEELLQKNIKKRGRNFEQNIPAAYLQKITNSYYSFLKNGKLECPVIWVNVNEYDIVGNLTHFNRIVKLIETRRNNYIHYM